MKSLVHSDTLPTAWRTNRRLVSATFFSRLSVAIGLLILAFHFRPQPPSKTFQIDAAIHKTSGSIGHRWPISNHSVYAQRWDRGFAPNRFKSKKTTLHEKQAKSAGE